MNCLCNEIIPEFEDEAAFDVWLLREQLKAEAAGQTMDREPFCEVD